jgi:NitT/TauT family transport system substrate-binding protein
MEKMWPDFICNLMIVKQRLIEQEPETVQLLVQSAARSGVWAQQNIPEAARIASQYWGQPVALIEFALNTPEKRIIYDKFLPKKEELQRMADMMKKYGLIRESNIEGLVEDRFALRSNLSAVDNFGSILKLP